MERAQALIPETTQKTRVRDYDDDVGTVIVAELADPPPAAPLPAPTPTMPMRWSQSTTRTRSAVARSLSASPVSPGARSQPG